MKSCSSDIVPSTFGSTTKDVRAAGQVAQEVACLAEMVVRVDHPRLIADFLCHANGLLASFNCALGQTGIPPGVGGYRQYAAASGSIADCRRELGRFGDPILKPTALSDRHEAAVKRESDIDRESGSVSSSRQLIERVQSLLVVRGCRSSGTPRSCFVRGVAKSDRCLFPHLALERMMSDPLDLFH